MTRACTIPGCQSAHHSRGWCQDHYDRWRRHGAPLATTAFVCRPLNARHVAEMSALADEGLSRADIAAVTGWSVQTVGRHVGHLVPVKTGPKPDVARYRRMLRAVATAEYGTRDEIARRFGLKDRFSLKTTLVTARRRVSEASRCERNSHGA